MCFFQWACRITLGPPKTCFTLGLECLCHIFSPYDSFKRSKTSIKKDFSCLNGTKCKIHFGHCRCIFHQKNEGQFFSPKKKPNRGRGGLRRVWQTTTLFRFFFPATFPTKWETFLKLYWWANLQSIQVILLNSISNYKSKDLLKLWIQYWSVVPLAVFWINIPSFRFKC